jgi:hypothetical protein
MPRQRLPRTEAAKECRPRAARRSLGHLKVTTIKYVPASADEIRQQFVELFDLLGLDRELFDNASPNHTIRIKQ